MCTNTKDKCHCHTSEHAKMAKGSKFIQPCLLLLLKESENHGYGLLEKVKNFGFYDAGPDISVVYRNLAKLETEEYVKTSWEKAETGPDKKVYNLTRMGEDSLREYVTLFEERKLIIEKFINNYNDMKE